MECFLALVVLVILIVATTNATAKGGGQAGSYAFRHVAHRYGGHFITGTWFGHPSVRFKHGESQGLLHITKLRGGGRGGLFTQLLLDWSDPSLSLQIYPVDLTGWLSPVRGLQRMATGDTNFDRSFLIFCNDPSRGAKLLSEGVRLQIYRLQHLLNNAHIEVVLMNGRWQIRKLSAIRQYDTLDHFMRMSLTLYDQAMLTQCEGIEFVGEKTAAPVGDITCKICGEDIVTDMVFCKRCKTPHHGDCWQYNGGCSVFACQETESATPRIAQLMPDP